MKPENLNKMYIGILGDPAKLSLYTDEFYEIIKWDTTETCFGLIGASEKDVKKQDFKKMFDKFQKKLGHETFRSHIPFLTNRFSKNFSAKIGLFPSSISSLIRGPGFSFAPFPINSQSQYLKLKSRVLSFTLSPFLPFKVVPLAYHPLGGKAAEKTKADTKINVKKIIKRFVTARKSSYFKWSYLEGGSGEKFLNPEIVEQVLNAVYCFDKAAKKRVFEFDDYIVVPRIVYGGGITDPEKAETIMTKLQNQKGKRIFPQCLIIGNLSEQNVKMTYKVIERVLELNE